MESNGFMFVVNPRAGSGRALAYGEKIKKLFACRGIETLVIPTSKDGDNSAFALGKRAAQDGVHTLVGVGGDGLLNLLFNGMMASGVPLEALPRLGFIQAGTGNNLAKNLGVPGTFDEAMAVIRHGHTVSIDVGLVTSGRERKYFLNVVSFGFDASVVEATANSRERSLLLKGLTYFMAAGKKIFLGFPSYRLALSAPGFNLETEVCLLAVLNGPSYGAIFQIAPEADPSDGLFEVCLIYGVGKCKAVEILIRAIKGKHVGLPQVRFLRVPSLVISSPEPLPWEVDGEVMDAERESAVSILPRALKVLVPPTLVGVQTPLRAKSEAPEFQPA